MILGKLEEERIPYAVTTVLQFYILVGMTSGIISEPGLLKVFNVLMIAR